jgi:hypothetical protein
MKKELKKVRAKKLHLHREALRQLDPERDGDFLKVAGGMPMSPVPHCFLTNNGC